MDRRRAALIATAVTVPFILIAAFVLGFLSGGTGGSSKHSTTPAELPPVSASAPPNATAQFANCTKLLEALPVSLRSLAPRTVHTTPDTAFVVAWGDPPIVLACGAKKPTDLYPGSGEDFRGDPQGPFFDITRSGDANVYTTVDRGPYVALTIPAKYQAADYLPTLSAAIRKALPAVCATGGTTDPDKLCTRRK